MAENKIVIVPHTHWDREWYLPFQRFRYMLVEMIDDLLEILKKQEYHFMLDGQTIVLEDYFEIREENREELLQHIRDGKITVGPWYLLPDQWLVGAESLIRNIEYSQVLAKKLNIPQMKIGYLPDMFGHSSAMPQILSDLTDFKAAVLWRGVPPDLMTVRFNWKSHPSSSSSIPAIYLPGGYGNASRFPEDYPAFVETVNDEVSTLEPYSPVPIYLLMNGSDHLFPQAFVKDRIDQLRTEGEDVSLGSLDDYVNFLEEAIKENDYHPPLFCGEFRSPARAPLLQDTYSARMWIKIWNQKVEDLLVRKAEPISAYLWLTFKQQYPTSYLQNAWKWLLRNHPHDSICGCSVDTTHEEMRSRFSWAETIAESIIQKATNSLDEMAASSTSKETTILVFNSGGTPSNPVYIEFTAPRDLSINGLKSSDGRIYDVQRMESRDDIFFETTVGMRTAKMSMRLIPGRKLLNFYINDVEYFDGEDPEVLELRFISDLHPVGDFDMEEFKRTANEIIDSKKYKKIHLIASRPTQQIYASFIPLHPWSFTQLVPVEENSASDVEVLKVEKDRIQNQFYSVSFKKDGSLKLHDKQLGIDYERLHVFEDYGDRGDEYTFGRVLPEKVSVKKVKREIISNGPIIAEIRQVMEIELFEKLDDSREKRTGKIKIPVESIFRFYRDSPRIEVRTRFTNKAMDHRLRICFDLPFQSEKTLTATHFGVVERNGAPAKVPEVEILEKTESSFPEMPSGIQAQKRFIRVDDDNGTGSITVFNMGLPEVELVNGNRVALTLVRSIGWLSRADIPERPVHAGPGEETPGAQELDTRYEYHYGFSVHSLKEPIHFSANLADAALDQAQTMYTNKSDRFSQLEDSIVQVSNPDIRISSIRVRDDTIIITFYNLANTQIGTKLKFGVPLIGLTEIHINGKTKEKHELKGNSIDLKFSPREIKMCRLTLI